MSTTNKRPHSPSLNNLGNQFSPSQAPSAKRQQLLDTISNLNFNDLLTPPSDPLIPDFAKTIISQQQQIIKQLSGLLQVASEILTDQTTNNIDFSSAFEQRQREHLLVLTGLPESTETQPMARAESDSKVVRQILNELQIDRCLPSAVFRLGKQRQPGSKPRPLKILFPCSAAVTEALRNKKKLICNLKHLCISIFLKNVYNKQASTFSQIKQLG
ncbi:unnamed protein product [Meloidogyne enterolobii]|uniref:Uncharacterized protein n=1 Tax=Meloidogyne enterolobii TaxID=390850 RepID=A0ACB1A2A4_MELEN